MTKQQEDWFRTAIGRAMNLDGVADLQCVDVPNDYAEYLFGDWQETIGRGNAKDKYQIAPDSHWIKIPNDPTKPDLIPEPGDVIVWPSMPKIDNPAGHIAVVESATAEEVTVIEQDGFLQIPARRKTHPYIINGVLPIGWLRPKQEKIIGANIDMTIIVKPLTPLEVTLKKSIPLFEIATGQKLTDSGTWMRLTQKTNVVNGSTYYIPFDRAEKGEVFGFKEEDVYAKGNTVTEVADQDWKTEFEQYRSRMEKLVGGLETKINQMTDDFDSERIAWKQAEDGYIRAEQLAKNDYLEMVASKEAELKDLKDQYDKAKDNAKDVARWTWLDHFQAAIQKLLGKGGE
jgi:hypothetical protein